MSIAPTFKISELPRIEWHGQEQGPEFMPVKQAGELEIRRVSKRIEVLKRELAAEEDWLKMLETIPLPNGD